MRSKKAPAPCSTASGSPAKPPAHTQGLSGAVVVGHAPKRPTSAARAVDSVAAGTVVVDEETLVDGSTTNAEIETLEDTNITTGGRD